MERDGIDGMEQLCLNCGFGQIPNIIPNEALSDDAEDYLLRNRSDGWSDTYLDLYGTTRKSRGQVGKTNRLGMNNKPKGRYKPKQIDNRQTVTKETIQTWNKIKEELELTGQEKD
jgi:hypothetical protein